MTSRRLAGVLLAVAAGNLVFRLVCPRAVAPDEAYYWDWSRHRDICYLSKGPLIAWLMWLAARVAGDTEAALALPGLACSAVAIGLLVAECRASRHARWLLGALLLAPLFHLGQLVSNTDAPLAVGWVLALRGARAVLDREHPPRAAWLALGGGLGLGVLAKPSMLLFCLPLAVTLCRRRTAVRGQPGWLLAAGLLAAGLAPQAAWNAVHGWPMLAHLRDQGWQSGGWRFGLPELLAAQLLLVSPMLWWALWRANLAALRDPRSAGEELAAWSFVLVLGLFGAQSLRATVELNWPLPAYLGGLLVLAERRPESPGRWQRWAVGWALAVNLLFRSLPFVAPRVESSTLLAIDPSRRMAGLEQLAEPIDGARAALAEEAGVAAETIGLAATHYQTAAAAAFYVPGHPEVTTLPRRRACWQYDLWPAPALSNGTPVLLVARRSLERPPQEVVAVCRAWRSLGVVAVRTGPLIADRYGLFALYDVDGAAPP